MENTVKYILGIDLEGMNEDLTYKGLNLTVDRITEIGAVLWEVEKKAPVQFLSELIDEQDRLPMSAEVIEITGITDEMLTTWGLKGEHIKATLRNLAFLMKKADFLMAHNGRNYDQPMLTAIFKRFAVEMPDTPWIDTSIDIEFPNKIGMRSLSALEHAHGFVNPFPHRAVTDVLSMLKIAAQYDIERMAKLAQSPKVKIIAKLSPPNWKDQKELETFNKAKHKISRARFKWEPQRKKWSKELPQILIDEGKVHFDFEWALE